MVEGLCGLLWYWGDDMCKKELLYQYAKEFREAIESVNIDGLPNEFYIRDFFEVFPKRQCGSTSILLGQYFLDKGIATWYVCGIDSENKSHAWLTTSNPNITNDYLIIDITGDQFGMQYPKVYVGKMNNFYKLYDNEIVQNSYPLCKIDCVIDYKKIYDVICSCICKEEDV